jgi:hypothetical protein
MNTISEHYNALYAPKIQQPDIKISGINIIA